MTRLPSSRSLAVLLALGLPVVSSTAQGGSATYDVTFSASWSAATHPVAFPPNPHFSPLIGATHDAATRFWQRGALATNGIESMAETGATTLLRNEVNAAIASGGADQVLQFGSLPNSPGSRTDRFTITAEFPRVTLVSMLAPSPDWFVGVSGLLLRQNGQWVEEFVIQLRLHDSGTDSGTSYQSPNQNTAPAEPIDYVTTASGPFLGQPEPLATFTFRRVHSTNVYGCGTNLAGSMSVIGGVPRVGQSVTMAVHDPSGTMGTPSDTGFLVSPVPDAAFPCGTPIPGFGLASPGAAGELLVGVPSPVVFGPAWNGAAAALAIPIPNHPPIAGLAVYVQAVMIDPSARIGLTDAVQVVIGP